MTPQVVDLDRLVTWPRHLLAELTPLLSRVVKEREAVAAHDLSTDRYVRRSPDTPTILSAHKLIDRAMAGRRINVFHATRLQDFDEILRDGLRPLDLDEQIAKLRSIVVKAGVVGSPQEFDNLISDVDIKNGFFRTREGQVWFTPLRRLLHDGGCDVFFEHWGGEAIQRLAAMASPVLEKAIQKLGEPAVVMANIPAFGCCCFSDSRLAPTMLGLLLEKSGLTEVCPESWDVMVKQAVPREWIESVLTPDDPTLRA